MSRRISQVPFVVGTDGTIYVNIAQFGMRRAEPLLSRALDEQGELLVACKLSRSEVKALLKRIDDSATEAAAFALGACERRSKVRY